MEPIHLDYSEEAFGGFQQVSIDIDANQIQVNTIVPDYLEEQRDKQLAIDDFMQGLGSSMGMKTQTTTQPIYIEGEGQMQWHKVRTICYYQHKEPLYSFRIKLIDQNGYVVDIQGKATTKREVEKTGIDNEEILDAPSQTSASDNEETAYLKAMYRTLVNIIEPIATENILIHYQQTLKTASIPLHEFSIQNDGLAIPYRQWLLKKTALIPWNRIAIKHKAKYSIIGDKEQAKYQVNIPYYKLQNANALVALIKAKQKEMLPE